MSNILVLFLKIKSEITLSITTIRLKSALLFKLDGIRCERIESRHISFIYKIAKDSIVGRQIFILFFCREWCPVTVLTPDYPFCL